MYTQYGPICPCLISNKTLQHLEWKSDFTLVQDPQPSHFFLPTRPNGDPGEDLAEHHLLRFGEHGPGNAGLQPCHGEGLSLGGWQELGDLGILQERGDYWIWKELADMVYLYCIYIHICECLCVCACLFIFIHLFVYLFVFFDDHFYYLSYLIYIMSPCLHDVICVSYQSCGWVSRNMMFGTWLRLKIGWFYHRSHHWCPKLGPIWVEP